MKTVLAFAAVLVSTAAFAGDVDPNGFEKQHFVTSASRAEIAAPTESAKPAETPTAATASARVSAATAALGVGWERQGQGQEQAASKRNS